MEPKSNPLPESSENPLSFRGALVLFYLIFFFGIGCSVMVTLFIGHFANKPSFWEFPLLLSMLLIAYPCALLIHALFLEAPKFPRTNWIIGIIVLSLAALYFSSEWLLFLYSKYILSHNISVKLTPVLVQFIEYAVKIRFILDKLLLSGGAGWLLASVIYHFKPHSAVWKNIHNVLTAALISTFIASGLTGIFYFSLIFFFT